MKKRLMAILLTVALMCSMLAGCGSDAGDEGKVGEDGEKLKEITLVNTTQDYDGSPFAGVSWLRLLTRWMTHGTLFGAFPGATLDELQPRIAKSITMVDEVTAEIELFDYVTDSAGNKIDAHDVVFSYETAATSGNFSPKLLGSIASIEATGDYTLRLTAANKSKGTMELIVTNIPITSQEWYEGADESERTMNPAVTGPYKIRSFTSGGTIVFEKVENFWQTDESMKADIDKQPLDVINAVVITEGSQRVIALENQEVDVSFVDTSDIHRFLNDDGTAADGWMVKAIQDMPQLLFFNGSENSVFKDNEELRQAIAYAIDSQAVRLGGGVPDGIGENVRTVGNSTLGGYNTQWDEEDYYDYDPEKAKELLAKAGYEPGELTLKVMTLTNSGITSAAAVVQSNLSDVGINMEINSYDQALFNTYMYDSTQWDMMIYAVPSQNGLITDLWLNAFDARSFEQGTMNFVEDEHLQELLVAASEEFTEESIDAFHYYLKDQAYVIGLYNSVQYYAAQDGVEEMGLDGMQAAVPTLYKLADDYETVVSQ